MSAREAAYRRRARWLLRWYPREWRSRYEDEFTELLVADMEDRPHRLSRGVDVARNGLLARLATIGLAGHSLDPGRQPRRALLTLGAAAWAFLVLAAAVWAQLTIGWQWSPPDTLATSTGMVVMTLAVLLFAFLCAACVAPVLWAAAAAVVRGRGRGLIGPVLLTAGGLGTLVVGTHHFANGWPGTGGHPWAHQGIVPGGVAAYAWASTLFVTSYWLHPGALQHFPGGEVAWMCVSPIALVAAVWGSMKTIARLGLSRRVVRYERTLSVLVAGAMCLFFLGAAPWILDGGPGPRNLFHAGAIDVVELVAMAVLAMVAARAASAAHRSLPPRLA